MHTNTIRKRSRSQRQAQVCCHKSESLPHRSGKNSIFSLIVEILDGNYGEIRAWILHGQVDCGFLSSIVAEPLRFYPLWDDPLCAVLPENHPLAEKAQISLTELFRYPLIIETPGCDNDIQHLLKKCPTRPRIAYSFRDDPLIMAFVRRGLGVTISQELVLESTGPGRESSPGPWRPAAAAESVLPFPKPPIPWSPGFCWNICSGNFPTFLPRPQPLRRWVRVQFSRGRMVSRAVR